MYSLSGKGLFDEETPYSFQNLIIKNVITNSKHLMNINNDINIKNSLFSNITCNGDENESSIIYFDTGNLERSLELSNTVIVNSFTNGPLIKIKGEKNKIHFESLQINNVTSSGQLIENTSLSVNI